MSTDPLVIGRIVATTPVDVQVGSAEGQERVLLTQPDQALTAGQILQARVLAASNASVILEILGQQIEATGLKGLMQGQALTLRVASTSPELTLEVLAERTPAERNLATALSALFSGGDGARVRADLSAALARLQTVPDLPRVIPPTLMQNLANNLAPVNVETDVQTLAQNIRTFFSSLGLGTESALRAVVDGTGKQDVLPDAGFKGLLNRLDTMLQNAMPAQPATAAEMPAVPQTLVDEIVAVLQRFHARWQPLLTGQGRAGFESVMRSIIESARELPNLRGPELQESVRSLLNTVRALPTIVDQLPAARGEALLSEAQQLVQALEQQIGADERGRALLTHLLLLDAARGGEQVRERLEAMQVLNTHLAEKGQQLHLMLPVAIMQELTDVQIKQFLGESRGRKGERQSLTVVMLLTLESLGRVRIDALAQQKALYVHVYVERPEIVPVVESLGAEFGEQLQARGFKLARLVCRTDEKKIDHFNQLGADMLDEGEGLVDFRI